MSFPGTDNLDWLAKYFAYIGLTSDPRRVRLRMLEAHPGRYQEQIVRHDPDQPGNWPQANINLPWDANKHLAIYQIDLFGRFVEGEPAPDCGMLWTMTGLEEIPPAALKRLTGLGAAPPKIDVWYAAIARSSWSVHGYMKWHPLTGYREGVDGPESGQSVASERADAWRALDHLRDTIGRPGPGRKREDVDRARTRLKDAGRVLLQKIDVEDITYDRLATPLKLKPASVSDLFERALWEKEDLQQALSDETRE